MKGKLWTALAVIAFMLMLLRTDAGVPDRVVMPEKAPAALESAGSSPGLPSDSGYRVLIFQPDSKDIPAPVLVQEQPEQGQPVYPGQNEAREARYGWGYYWWWWLIIAAIIIFFIIIFTSFGGRRRGGHPPEDRL